MRAGMNGLSKDLPKILYSFASTLFTPLTFFQAKQLSYSRSSMFLIRLLQSLLT